MAKKKRNKAERSRRLTIVLCILASLTFWLSIKLSGTYVSQEPIDIDYRLPQGLVFAQAPPTMLEASVRATGWELLAQSFSPQDRLIIIDSTDIGANPDGIISIRRAVAQAFASEGLSVDAMTDERVVLNMDRVDTKRVPIKLVSAIIYAGGYRSSQPPVLSPDSVQLSGPASMIADITSWPTDSLVLAGVQDTIVTTALLQQPDNSTLRIDPEQVAVSVESQQFTEKRLYVPVQIVGARPKDSISLFPRQVLVSFPVGLKDYNRVKADDFTISVDVTPLKRSDSRQLPVLVRKAPNGIGKPVVKPRTIEAFIREGQGL